MKNLVPFAKFSKKASGLSFLPNTYIVVDRKGIPLGFVFGRDSFISLLEHIDSQFEEKVKDQVRAFDNPAGRLIDLIEEKLPLNPNFVKDLRSSITKTGKTNWIPFEEVKRLLNV